MRKALYADRDLYCDIFTTMFAGNTGTTWVLRKSINPKKALRRMAGYTFALGMAKKGVYISDNNKGIAVCHRCDTKVPSLGEIWAEIVFAITALNLKNLPGILRRESYRKKQRPSSGKYLYFWFLGALPGERSAAMELGKGIVREADKLNLPIYLETAEERLKPVYERYGFETFHFWEQKEKGIRFWFLKREPHTF